MSSQVNKEITILRNVLVFVVLPLIVYAVAFGKISALVTEKDSAVEVDLLRLKKFYHDGFSSPTQELIDAQKRSCQEARELLDSIASYCYVPTIEIPETVDDKRVYFKEQLYLVQKELQNVAGQAKIAIPPSLGFSEDLPSDDAVADKLLQVALIRSLMLVLLDEGVVEISSVKFLDVVDVVNAQEEQLPYKNISISLSMTCSQDSLQKILYEFGGMNPYVVVTGLTAENTSSGALEVKVVVMQLRSSVGGLA